MIHGRTGFLNVRQALPAALAGVAIALVTLGAYAGALHNGFVWDTVHYLRYSVNWAPGSGPAALSWMLLSTEVSNWHPVTWLSWAIDYRLYGGLNPSGFHLSNIVLHGVNSILVGWLAFRLFCLHSSAANDAEENRGDFLLASALCGALFAVHPQHVQSVAWVAERKDLLCQLFILACLLNYLRDRATPASGRGSAWAVTFFALASMSKPMAVSVPLVLLILDHYPLRRLTFSRGYWRSLTGLVLEKTPFVIIAGTLALITLLAQSEGGSMVDAPLSLRLLNASNSITLYLHKFLWPVDFSPFYPYAIKTSAGIDWRHWLPVGEIVALTTTAIFAWRKGHPQWLAAWIFYLVTLLPVLGIVQVGVQGAADRYAYLPTLPFYLLLGAAFLAMMRGLRKHALTRVSAWLATAALLFSLGVLTHQEVKHWNNDLSLWMQAYRQYPNDQHVNVQLGITLLNTGIDKAALDHFERAAGSESGPSEFLAWRGIAYMRLGRHQEALDAFITLGVNADSIPGLVLDEECVQYNIGWNLAHLGATDDSIDMFSRIRNNKKLHHDAQTWMAQLATGPDGDHVNASGLPRQCEHPLPKHMMAGR